ncbi:type II toxin-antitoxin system RelE/ParE family toxin [Variovorax guangxiensis]|uniref:type II toxin-antitoxin system RelE/ParE family toxin n=1 Tax=Variovorax guangxiensis TaxID=1775474 RepID=UPI0038F7859E
MTWSLHPGAVQDVAGILDFYAERAGAIVAQRFLSEFERVADLLVKHPGFGTPSASGRRAFPLRVFPYTLVYRQGDAGILILVVRHQHRKPSYGGARR